MKEKICLNCGIIHKKRNKKFCNLSCSTIYNNKRRDYSFFEGDKNPSKRLEVRKKISEKMVGRIAPWMIGEKNHNHKTNGGINESAKEKMRVAKIGKHTLDKHPNWKGGKSLLIYNNEFKLIRAKLIKNIHNCEICGSEKNKRNLEVHHMDKNTKNNSIKNLKVVCKKCHSKLHRGEKND